MHRRPVNASRLEPLGRIAAAFVLLPMLGAVGLFIWLGVAYGHVTWQRLLFPDSTTLVGITFMGLAIGTYLWWCRRRLRRPDLAEFAALQTGGTFVAFVTLCLAALTALFILYAFRPH